VPGTPVHIDEKARPGAPPRGAWHPGGFRAPGLGGRRAHRVLRARPAV